MPEERPGTPPPGPQGETARAPWGPGLLRLFSLPLWSGSGEASTWDASVPLFTEEMQDHRVARRENHSVAGGRRGHRALGPAHDHSVGLTHSSGHTYTCMCTHTHGHTHAILSSGQRCALRHSPSASQSQSESESLIAVGGPRGRSLHEEREQHHHHNACAEQQHLLQGAPWVIFLQEVRQHVHQGDIEKAARGEETRCPKVPPGQS